jgi:hypothetical protein
MDDCRDKFETFKQRKDHQWSVHGRHWGTSRMPTLESQRVTPYGHRRESKQQRVTAPVKTEPTTESTEFRKFLNENMEKIVEKYEKTKLAQKNAEAANQVILIDDDTTTCEPMDAATTPAHALTPPLAALMTTPRVQQLQKELEFTRGALMAKTREAEQLKAETTRLRHDLAMWGMEDSSDTQAPADLIDLLS